jgi:PAS domain-containing protein
LKDEKKTDETVSDAVHTLINMGKFIENVEDIIVVQDLGGKYLYYNAPGLKKVQKTGEALNRETSVEWKGETLWYNDTLSPIKDESDKVKAVVTISRNITKNKQSEKKIKEYIETLEKWQKYTVDRELKMVELKEEIKELKKKRGERKQRY